MIYSGIPHTTASLFHMRDFVKIQEKTLLYVDSDIVTREIQNIGTSILGESIEILTHASDLFTLHTLTSRIILVPSHILHIEGNILGIKKSHLVTIQRGDKIEQNDLIEKLLNIGYEQSDYRGEIGTYKREGAVIRIMTKECEWTIEYFDNEIESIVATKNDTHTHEDIILLPRIRGGGEKSTSGVNKELLGVLKDFPLILLSCEFSHEREWFHANIKNLIEYSSVEREGSIRLDIVKPEVNTMEDLKTVLTGTYEHISIFSKYEKKLREFFELNQLPPHHIEMTRYGYGSFMLREKKNYLVLGDDLFSKIFIENRVRKSSIKHLDLLLALKEGDLVVHREHGIGRYITLEKKRIGLIEREYMQILYGNGDKVFLPLTELGRITKYVGEPSVELSRLEGKEWEKALSKTDEEVALIAEEILSTEAKRRLTKRIPFGKFENEETAFLLAFPHLHTPDQKAIIQEIQSDMESEYPMDRLISGDVGFGKTEVAMNAIYKAVLSGMQVAVISPLLILAEEHRETFDERLGAFGVKIASLTRLTSKKEETEILKKMKTGDIDVVVGTHRLLSEDIHFRRLGLLIIDEEHRFGVGHKEAIKKMKAHIDILSLSATPIPRSLNLALSGLKKISLLTTPPPRKKPIETIVIRWDEHVIKTAIEQELARSGQVIILHNRVRALPMIEKEIREILSSDTIEQSANGESEGAILSERRREKKKDEREQSESEFIDPSGAFGTFQSGKVHRVSSKNEIKIVTTHGQMPAQDIEERIHDFKHGKYDILLTTTVIENGVNFLGANTIIVSDAEEFGLAQLHQIRGRVGRKDVTGKCYLMYRKYELSQIERERLIVLSENSGLGSGYEIAMRDMQIRGTGDILGFRQSGKSKEVGISLYFQLLEEKIETLKFGKSKKENTKIELDLSYVLPDDFFDSDIDKLSFFREIEAIESLEDLDRMEETFLSPQGSEGPLSNLFLMMRTSLILSQYEVSKLSKVGQNYHFDFYEGTTPHILRAFLERFDSKHEMVIISVTKIRVETKNWKDVVSFLRSITKT